MSQYQVYLNDEQKNYLLKYMRKRRYVSMMIMIISFVLILASLWLYNNDILLLNKFKGAVISFFLIFLMSFKVRNEVRLGNIAWICLLVLFVVMNISLLGYESFSHDTNVFLDKTEFYISFIALTEIFITEFIRGAERLSVTGAIFSVFKKTCTRLNMGISATVKKIPKNTLIIYVTIRAVSIYVPDSSTTAMPTQEVNFCI